MDRRTIHELLDEARRTLKRLTPREAWDAAARGGVLVDTRSEDERRLQGVVPGAVHCPLSVLEWRADPASGHSDLGLGFDAWIVLLCAEGYSSSLAAARLHVLGFHRATDVVGGVHAWKEAGLPVETPPT